MSARQITLLTFLAALKARPEVHSLFLAASQGSLLATHRYHSAVDADADLRSLRNLWLDAVRAEELRMVA
jgi:hypothetical protein